MKPKQLKKEIKRLRARIAALESTGNAKRHYINREKEKLYELLRKG